MQGEVMRNVMIVCVMSLLLTPLIWAQTVDVSATPITDTDIQLLRSNLQAGKNHVIADTMKFTDAESGSFWPVYRDYARDQQAIGDQRVQLIKDYAKNFDTMDNPKAKDMAQRLMTIDSDYLQLRERYWSKFEQALGAKRAAKFYQVDNRLTMMINVQLAADVPLIP
jgi:uncharacterized membrane protein